MRGTQREHLSDDARHRALRRGQGGTRAHKDADHTSAEVKLATYTRDMLAEGAALAAMPWSELDADQRKLKAWFRRTAGRPYDPEKRQRRKRLGYLKNQHRDYKLRKRLGTRNPSADAHWAKILPR